MTVFSREHIPQNLKSDITNYKQRKLLSRNGIIRQPTGCGLWWRIQSFSRALHTSDYSVKSPIILCMYIRFFQAVKSVICRCSRIMYYVSMTILALEASSFWKADAVVSQHINCRLQTDGTRNHMNLTAASIVQGVMVLPRRHLSSMP